jgi:hypothetical protein
MKGRIPEDLINYFPSSETEPSIIKIQRVKLDKKKLFDHHLFYYQIMISNFDTLTQYLLQHPIHRKLSSNREIHIKGSI